MTSRTTAFEAAFRRQDEREAKQKEQEQQARDARARELLEYLNEVFGEHEPFLLSADGFEATSLMFQPLQFFVGETYLDRRTLRARLDLVIPDGPEYDDWWENPANRHLNGVGWEIESLADVGDALLWVQAHEPLEIKPWPTEKPKHAYGIKQVICPRCGIESEHEYTDAADISYWKCPKCGMVSKLTPYDLPENGAGDGGDFSTVENSKTDKPTGITYEALREAMVKLAAGQEDDAQGRMLAKYLWQIAVRLEQMAITTLAMNGEIAAAWIEGELRMRDRVSWNTTLDILREEILEVSNDVYRLSNLTGKLGT